MIDKATNGKKSVSREDKRFRDTLAPAVEPHKNARLTVITYRPRIWYRSILGATVSASPYEPHLVDSVGLLDLVSSNPSDSYNFSYTFFLIKINLV